MAGCVPISTRSTGLSFRALGSAEFLVLTPSERLDGEYLRYLLNSSDFVRFATGLNTGDRPRVDFKQLGRYPVPLPKLGDQKRIVGAIEQQLSRIEVAQAALARSPAPHPPTSRVHPRRRVAELWAGVSRQDARAAISWRRLRDLAEGDI